MHYDPSISTKEQGKGQLDDTGPGQPRQTAPQNSSYVSLLKKENDKTTTVNASKIHNKQSAFW